MPIDDQLAAAIATATGIRLDSNTSASVGGGSINAGFRVTDTAGNSYFLKVNVSQGRDMFEAEREGLLALGEPDTLRVPRPIVCGSTSCHAFLLLEWLDLSGSGRDALDLLGHGLAGLHRVTNRSFGWHRDNTIGSTPQKNQYDDNWVRFYRECRLRYQLELAAANGFTGNLQRQGEKLLDGLEQFFSTYKPCPSLLHGDLWGGNWGVTVDGAPAIFDPAVYFGDREADIAMTSLFGGFGPRFYEAYESAWPLDDGFETRRVLYNMYHVLNHLNLFGGNYLAQAERMANKLLADLGHC